MKLPQTEAWMAAGRACLTPAHHQRQMCSVILEGLCRPVGEVSNQIIVGGSAVALLEPLEVSITAPPSHRLQLPQPSTVTTPATRSQGPQQWFRQGD